jgi:hypothetical protein
MAIDRELWEMTINGIWVPQWPCPECGATSLSVVKDSLRTSVDATTARHEKDRDFEEEYETGRFVCLLQCSRCKESCSVSGDYDMGIADTDEGNYTYSRGSPKSVTPALPVIRIPARCPQPIKEEVIAAFKLQWDDYASCLNRIRNALELILNDLGIPRAKVNKKKKRIRLPLHSRIKQLEESRPKLKNICDRMMAVKHLGNAGSHAGVKVNRNDVFDGFDILERVLDDMYTNSQGEMAKMVSEINKRGGPRKGRTRQ